MVEPARLDGSLSHEDVKRMRQVVDEVHTLCPRFDGQPKSAPDRGTDPELSTVGHSGWSPNRKPGPP